MSRFESFLTEQFEDYIAYRHQLGYDTKGLQTAICSKRRPSRPI